MAAATSGPRFCGFADDWKTGWHAIGRLPGWLAKERIGTPEAGPHGRVALTTATTIEVIDRRGPIAGLRLADIPVDWKLLGWLHGAPVLSVDDAGPSVLDKGRLRASGFFYLSEVIDAFDGPGGEAMAVTSTDDGNESQLLQVHSFTHLWGVGPALRTDWEGFAPGQGSLYLVTGTENPRRFDGQLLRLDPWTGTTKVMRTVGQGHFELFPLPSGGALLVTHRYRNWKGPGFETDIERLEGPPFKALRLPFHFEVKSVDDSGRWLIGIRFEAWHMGAYDLVAVDKVSGTTLTLRIAVDDFVPL